MNAKSPECYTTEPRARCLRVEVAAGRSLLLPLDQFVFGELLSDDKQQKLRLVFATHEVLISGHSLRRVEMAVHRLELSAIVKLPEKYQSLVAENQPIIQEITVTESKPPDGKSQTALN